MCNHELAIDRFRGLHSSGCFVLPNPWDVGTTRYLEQMGFEALATTSAGMAFARGLPDDQWAITRDAALSHIREIVAATRLPVNADYQSGFALEPEGVSANVALCVATGVAGLSIEDSTGDPGTPLYEKGVAVERIRAARAALDATGVPVILTGRCEAWIVGHAEPARTATERLVAYAEAGADCLYAPGVRKPEEIRAIVKAVSPKPVNVLATGELSARQLADLGVRRISVGSALSRVAWGAFARAVRSIVTDGSFASFAEAIPYAEINGLFGDRR